MTDAHDPGGGSIHHKARESAEQITGLLIATDETLVESPRAVAESFFRTYDDFSRRLSKQQIEQRRFAKREIDRLARRLAVQAAWARFSRRNKLTAEVWIMAMGDPVRAFFRSSDQVDLFVRRTYHSLRESLSTQNREQ